MLQVTIEDNATAELLRLAREYPAFYRRALKSLGWMGQKKIKKGIESGAPGGQAYEKKMPPARRRLMDQIFGRQEKSRYPILGGLRKAVGYDKRDVNQGTILIGWLSPTAVRIGSKMEKGVSYPVTRKMRGRAYHGGLLLQKPQIVVPARPTFKPMFPIVEKESVEYLTKKIKEYIENPAKRGAAKSRRKYRVYGK